MEKKNDESNINLRENDDLIERKKNRYENQREEYPIVSNEINNLNHNRNNNYNNRQNISTNSYHSTTTAMERKNHYGNDQIQQNQQLKSSQMFDEYNTRNVDRKRGREIIPDSGPESMSSTWGGNRDRNGSDNYVRDRSTDRGGVDKRY